jgi:hypothetical protein
MSIRSRVPVLLVMGFLAGSSFAEAPIDPVDVEEPSGVEAEEEATGVTTRGKNKHKAKTSKQPLLDSGGRSDGSSSSDDASSKKKPKGWSAFKSTFKSKKKPGDAPKPKESMLFGKGKKKQISEIEADTNRVSNTAKKVKARRREDALDSMQDIAKDLGKMGVDAVLPGSALAIDAAETGLKKAGLKKSDSRLETETSKKEKRAKQAVGKVLGRLPVVGEFGEILVKAYDIGKAGLQSPEGRKREKADAAELVKITADRRLKQIRDLQGDLDALEFDGLTPAESNKLELLRTQLLDALEAVEEWEAGNSEYVGLLRKDQQRSDD